MMRSIAQRVTTAWICSLRVKAEGFVQHPASYILAIPHSSLFVAAAYYRDQGMVTLASRSSDGDHIAAILKPLGYHVVRGSSSRGGANGFRALLNAKQEHPHIALTVDGPRGPAMKPKPGVVALAELTGLPILPAVAHGPGLRLRTWDRFLLPPPFARCTMLFGEPMVVPPGVDREECAARLERELQNLARTGAHTPKPHGAAR